MRPPRGSRREQRADEDHGIGESARIGPNSCPMVLSRSSAMPLRSSQAMKVKNGTGAAVSFDTMPKDALGQPGTAPAEQAELAQTTRMTGEREAQTATVIDRG